MARKSERVTLKVTETQKDRWETYAEDNPEYDNLSDLVKLSVEKEMSGALDREAVEQLDVSIDYDDIVRAVEAGLSDVNERLESVDDRLADVESTVKTNDDISKLARDIYEEMVVVEDEAEMRELGPMVSQEVEEELAIQSTPGAWATLFDVDEEDARRALSRAVQLFPDVEYYRTSEGPRRYYRVDHNRDGGGGGDEA